MKENSKFLTITGVSENNLKNISLKIPIGSITCVNGVSGSGKSTLVNSVIANEAFRREQLTKKQKGGYYKLVRPEFESIVGLQNVLIVNQKPLLHLESSTVATASGLGDLLRGGFLRDGVIECQCGSIVDNKICYETLGKAIELYAADENSMVFVEYSGGQQLNKSHLYNYMREHGFYHFQIEGNKKQYAISDIDSLKEGGRYKIRLVALNLSDLASKNVPTDRISVYVEDKLTLDFAYQTFCPSCLREYQKKSLSLFTTSRLSDKSGCCEACSGLGKTQVINNERLLIRSNSLDENFLSIPLEDGRYKSLGIYKSSFSKIIKKHRLKSSTPYAEFTDATQKEISDLIKEKLISRRRDIDLEGLLIENECPSCNGTGFNYKARAVRVEGRNISETLSLTVQEAVSVLKDPKLSSVLEALADLSLGHLSLERTTDTLSGGELQRIKLVKAISSGLTDSIIIIDEPSSGLSFGDVDKLFRLFIRLRDEGNTVLIVDHSEHIISKSDYSLHLGPGSGPSGGNIVERVNQIAVTEEISTVTIDSKAWERRYLALFPINHNNIVNQRVVLPLGAITAVVGNSGSGKSSLIQGMIECIRLNSTSEREKSDLISEIVLLNQKPIRASRRSSVLTFLGLSDELRKNFSQSNSAKALGLDSSYFTSNGINGACPHCEGDGEIDGVVCHSCCGSRFKSIVLSVTINDLNILDILNMPAVEVMDLELPSSINEGCRILVELGLGHLGLGRVLTDISGGEAQRLKLAKFLIENEKSIAAPSQHMMIILDEPCRGLSTNDSKFILGVFRELALNNNTVIVVEHNPYVISQSDYVIQLGPGVGALGGKILFCGPTEEFKADACVTAKNIPKSILGFSSLGTSLSEEDKHFALIRNYSQNHTVVGNGHVKTFPGKKSIISFAQENTEDGLYYFNPFCNDFFLSRVVPNSTIKERLSGLLKFGLEHICVLGRLINLKTAHKYISQDNIWHVYVPSGDPDLAYSLGGGWLALKQRDGFLNIATRLVDIEARVVGTRSISAKTFNTFYNGCNTCLGAGNLFFYDDFIGDPNKPVTDVEFYIKELQGYFKKHLSFKIKESVVLFKSEGLVDLSRPFSSLGSYEKSIAFFGFPNFSFVKKNGRKDALSDRVEWIGIIPTFDLHAEKIERDTGFKIGAVRQSVYCPECLGSRFKKEVSYYRVKGKAIYEQAVS